jgi:regulatory protein
MSTAWVSALRMLAARRLTEAQLWKKLDQKGFSHEEVAAAVERAKQGRFLDDRLYASLYIDGRGKIVGNRRLVADLVKRGIDRELACSMIEQSSQTEEERLAAAYEKLVRTKSSISMPTAARTLERKGFGAALIYQFLRSEMARKICVQDDTDVSFEDSL